jgi:hypothetical protein
MGGHMMVVCVQASKNTDLSRLAKDVRGMGTGLIIGNFRDKMSCEYVASELRRQLKVTNEAGEPAVEQLYQVTSMHSYCYREGQMWPVMLAGRCRSIKQVKIDRIVTTPDYGAVFVFQVDFNNMVCGQSHMRVAIHHKMYTDYMCNPPYDWVAIASMLETSSVRIIAGDLKPPPHDPLIAAVDRICATHTVVFERKNSSPVCFLGDIGKFTGTIEKVMEDHTRRKTNTMAFIPEVKGKTPHTVIPGVSKSFFALHGNRCIRSHIALKDRQASRNEKRQTKQNEVNPEDL